MSKMLRTAKKTKKQVDEGLAKVRAKPWAEPLGKALETTSSIVDALGNFVPGLGVIGGALSFGATVLNPVPTPQELMKEMRDIKEMMERAQGRTKMGLQKMHDDVESRILNPEGEIRSDLEEVKDDLKRVFALVTESNDEMSGYMAKMEDKVSKTYSLVSDHRYRDGIETVDAAYRVFLRDGFEGFQEFSYQLKTTAEMYLAPNRIRDYLRIIHEEKGLEMAQGMMEYVVVVIGKFLQMSAAWAIFRGEHEKVTAQFEQFNAQFNKLSEVFEEVTSQAFKPGEEVLMQQVAAVIPVTRDDMPTMRVSDNARSELNRFLERAGLQELQKMFLNRGITLQDLCSMDEEEMENVGVKLYVVRKRLKNALAEHSSGGQRTSGGSSGAAAAEVAVQRAAGGQRSQEETSRAAAAGVRAYWAKVTGQGAAGGQRSQEETRRAAAAETAVQGAAGGHTAGTGESLISSGPEAEALRKQAELSQTQAQSGKSPAGHQTGAGCVKETGHAPSRPAPGRSGNSPRPALPGVWLTTEGPAAEYQGDCLGHFLLMAKLHEGTACYKQRHDVPGEVKYLYRSGKTWCVHPTLGNSRGSLECPASGSSSQPPERGWTYFNGHEDLPADPLLSCRPLTSNTLCSTVTISARGEAEREHPDCLGTYRSVEGEYSAGQQVFRRQGGGEDRWLLVKPGDTNWGIRTSVEDPGAWIASPAGSVCPASGRAGHSDRLGQKGWQFSKDGKWLAGDITVTCSSHTYRK